MRQSIITILKNSILGNKLIEQSNGFDISKKSDSQEGTKCYYLIPKGYIQHLEQLGYKWSHANYMQVGVTPIAKIESATDDGNLNVIFVWVEKPKKTRKKKMKALNIGGSLIDSL